MKSLISYLLIIGFLGFIPLSWAEDLPLPQKIDHEIVGKLLKLEKIDEEILVIETQLESSPPKKLRKELKENLKRLQNQQDIILQGLEAQLFGPKPATVQDKRKSNLERQLDTQRKHHEAILESNVGQRLPTN